MKDVGPAFRGASAKPRLLLVHVNAMRHGIRLALKGVAGVCGEAATADEAIGIALSQQPDVCIVGREISGGGIIAVRDIAKVAPSAAVVVLADSPAADDLLACIQAGAIGYLPDSIGLAPLRLAVSAVAAGEAAIPRAMMSELVRELRGGTRAGESGLTPREAQVLSLLRRGHPTPSIAQLLGISPVTVRRHISTTMHKVGVDDRIALARSVADRRLTRTGGSSR